jgi:glycosyltransferase involved in cell wall biosynthesis/GT2 family glycosyltransferase
MAAPSASVIIPTVGGERLARVLASLGGGHQTIVVDNGSEGGAVAQACERFEDVEVTRLESNEGYTRAVNLGVERADGDAIVLLNDDCVCDPGFVEAITGALDPPSGVAMAAGVMRDWRDRDRIDSAGMELDETLLVFDYLNGEPVSVLENGVRDPIGPSGAAAAFDRATFRSVGGFDENLFAYWEDVDLVLRLRRLGLHCVLAEAAIGDHEHSATLGSGSARKNFLMGYGRGYVLRKWGVVNARRLGPVLLREAVLCAGQAAIDRNLAGVRGRVRGYREAASSERYPQDVDLHSAPGGAMTTLRRRVARRARLQRDGSPAEDLPRRTLAVFHLAGTSGPSRSLEAELSWLAEQGHLDLVIPGHGRLGDLLGDAADVLALDYRALTLPKPGLRGLLAAARELHGDVRRFRGLIRERRPDLVLAVTTMLPSVPIAAWLEGVPALVYCGELFDRGDRGGAARAFAGRLLAALTARLADGIIACSQTVAAQFARANAEVETVYPPVGTRYSAGDAAAIRRRFGIEEDASLLASVGYLTKGRGQDVLVRAMPAILERVPEARYLIAGDPFPRPQDLAYRDRLAELIAELGLERAVILAGHVEDVAGLYAAADVVVNPARFNEPFGRVPFEAAIAGRPAVVTRVGAIPELLEDGRSALIVSPDDPNALAGAVVRVLGDPELGAELVRGARAVIADRLTPAHSLEGFQHSVVATLARR